MTPKDTEHLIFRRASLTDVPRIVALLADDDLGKSREVLFDPLDTAYVEAFGRIDMDPNQLLVVMEHRERGVIGTMQLTFLNHLTHKGSIRAQIEAVRVASGERGGGLGARMFEWAIKEARARGCSLVQLTTDRQRPEAHAFYAKLGFVPSHVGFKLPLPN